MLPQRIALLAALALTTGCQSTTKKTVESGVLDLRDWSFEAEPILELEGEWRFYPDVLFDPEQGPLRDPEWLFVPSRWENPVGRGTYRMTVLLPEDAPPVRFEFDSIAGASRAWIDGVPLPEAGVLTDTLEETREDLRRIGLTVIPFDTLLEVHVQVANYRYRRGGIQYPVFIGLPEHMERRQERLLLVTAVSSIALLTMGLGFLVLFAYRPGERVHLYFSMFCLNMAVRDIVSDRGEMILALVPNIRWDTILRIDYLTLPLGVFFGFAMIALMSGYPARGRVVRGFQVVSALLSAVLLFAPVAALGDLLPVAQLWLLVALATSLAILVSGARRNYGASRLLLLLMSLTGVTFIYDILVSAGLFQSDVLIGVPGAVLFILGQGLLLVREFAHSITRNEALTRDLQEAHEALEATHASVLRFVPVHFLQLLGKETIVEIHRGDHSLQEMAILFCDLRKFTTLIESLGPDRAFPFINRYLKKMEPAINHNGGFISQYLGDAIMALFPGRADSAVQAGLDMVDALVDFNRDEPEGPVRFGIGIGSGTLMLGAIGGDERLNGSVIGDAVNQSARVEGMTKIYGVELLLDESTVLSLIHPTRFHLRELDQVVSVGRSRPSRIYEVLDALPDDIRRRRIGLLPQWMAALAAWRAGDFDAALGRFRSFAAADPDDAVARLYLERCEALQSGPRPEDWDGVTRLTRKS